MKATIELDIEDLHFLSKYCSSKYAIRKYHLTDPSDLVCCGNVWRAVEEKLEALKEEGFDGGMRFKG